MPYLFDDTAWEEYLYWQLQDKRTLKKINSLIRDLDRTQGMSAGQGKPELLRHSQEHLSSVRIDEKNRLVYRFDDGVLRIVSCRGHYSDR